MPSLSDPALRGKQRAEGLIQNKKRHATTKNHATILQYLKVETPKLIN